MYICSLQVMDHLEQERDRGITITSAAITFPWAGHQVSTKQGHLSKRSLLKILSVTR